MRVKIWEIWERFVCDDDLPRKKKVEKSSRLKYISIICWQFAKWRRDRRWDREKVIMMSVEDFHCASLALRNFQIQTEFSRCSVFWKWFENENIFSIVSHHVIQPKTTEHSNTKKLQFSWEQTKHVFCLFCFVSFEVDFHACKDFSSLFHSYSTSSNDNIIKKICVCLFIFSVVARSTFINKDSHHLSYASCVESS